MSEQFKNKFTVAFSVPLGDFLADFNLEIKLRTASGRRRVLRWTTAFNVKIVFADNFRLTGGSLSFEDDDIILSAQQRGRELERDIFVFFVAGSRFECFLPHARAFDCRYLRAVIAIIIAFKNNPQPHGSRIGIETERIRFIDVA